MMKKSGTDATRTSFTIAEWFEHGRQSFHKPDGVEAVRAMQKVINLNPGYRHADGDNPYFYLGKINEVEGRLHEAIIFYSRAMAVDPWDEESLIGRASCYTATRQCSLAIADFTKLLQAPDDKRKIPKKHLLYAISENYRRLKDWGQAIYWAQQALDADPGDERQQQLLQKIIDGMNK